MSISKRSMIGAGFRFLVGLRPSFQTLTMGTIKTANVLNNGLMVEDPAGILPETSTFTVADNDFSTGRVEILLGNYSLVSGIDYAVGVLAADTAANIVTAINGLLEFFASRVGADVTVQYADGSANVVTFEIRHYGTVLNITPMDPENGSMALGSPAPGPVKIS